MKGVQGFRIVDQVGHGPGTDGDDVGVGSELGALVAHGLLDDGILHEAESSLTPASGDDFVYERSLMGALRVEGCGDFLFVFLEFLLVFGAKDEKLSNGASR